MSNRDHIYHSECAQTIRCLSFVFIALLSVPLTSLSRNVEITLVHTTDLHGHIWPTVDYDGNDDLGGILRCASKIESIREEKSNVLLIDCGDSYQGSPESYLSEGKLIVDAFNVLDYDAWVLGNHEFDWGTTILGKRHDQVTGPFLAANLYFMSPSENWLPKIQPYIIREVEGVKIAIIGLVTPGVPRWSRPQLLDHALFKRSIETLENLWPEIEAEKPDVIVLATHQGYKHRGDDFANEIEAISKSFPEIDVIIGGHTHQPIQEMKYGNVLFTQAGYHGIWLGEVNLQYDTVKGAVIEKSGTLHLMDQSIPYHEGLLQIWNQTLNAANEVLTNIIGVVKEPLDAKPDRLGLSSMQQFLCRAIADGVDADFVLHGSLADKSIPAGEISYRDVWNIVPYENTIGVISITPSQIRSVLEENFSRRLYHYSLGPYGFSFDLEKNNHKVEIKKIRNSSGDALHARKKYRVAFNSYVLASGGERYMAVRHLADMPESRLEMLLVDTRGLVVELLKSNMRELEDVAIDEE